jgi:alanine dehydrogenase
MDGLTGGAGRPAAGDGVRLLTSAELHEAISLAEVVEMVERGYRARADGALVATPREQLRAEGTGTFLNVTPALAPGLGWACVFAYTGGNRGAGVPQKLALVFRTADGGLAGMIECDWLSWARTGATGAVATRHLARPGPLTLGVFGSGKQARAQVGAIGAVRELRQVLVHSRDPERRQRFADEVTADYGVETVPAGRPEEVLEAADVVSTATNSRTPVFDGAMLRPGTHVNAIGQHYPDRRELDDRAIVGSEVFVDSRERALLEEGELLIPMAAGLIDESHVRASLGEVITGRHAGRTSASQTTVLLSGGTAEEYLAVAGGVLERAFDKGIGTTVPVASGWAGSGAT